MKIPVGKIGCDNRIRSDLGDLLGLAKSIREFGILQKIVLVQEDGAYRVVMGGRRFAALRALGLAELEHEKHFLWLEEQNKNKDRQIAVELEENLRRKDLSWSEIALGRQRLLETMQRLYGAPAASRTGVVAGKARVGPEITGFGSNKLAAMLGESPAQTSKLLNLAAALQAVPGLAKAETMQAALRQIKTGIVLTQMKSQSAQLGTGVSQWSLQKGDFRALPALEASSVDLVYVDPPFGVDFSDNPNTAKAGRLAYDDTAAYALAVLDAMLERAFDCLRADRFLVTWFGFEHYCALCALLTQKGFSFNDVPYVWYTTRRENPNPFLKYTSSYQTCLVAWKGSPLLLRPGRENFCTHKPVAPADKLRISQQPVELVRDFILDTTAEGAHVVDFCAGTGTTGVAAVQLKRRVTMFEKDPVCWDIIQHRMAALK